MKRLSLGVALLSLLVLSGARPAQAQEYVYRVSPANPKEEVQVTGTIEEESPAGIKIKESRTRKVVTIPAADVRQVSYRIPRVALKDFRDPYVKEFRALDPKTTPKVRQQNLEAALAMYQKLAPQVRDSQFANRYVQYKMAAVLGELARDDPSRLDAAIAALTKFKEDFATGWEIAPALKQLAGLLEVKGEAAAAGKAYEDLAAVPGISQQVKEESEVLVAKMYLRGKKYPEAERKLETLDRTMATTDPQKPYIKVYLAQSQMAQGHLDTVKKRLEDAMKDSSDPNLKALAYNSLGDYYLRSKQPDQAFWQYLRVEVMYNQDPEEEAKALFHLSTLFDKVKNDPIRARQCADKLRGNQFAGTAYQRQAGTEK